MPGSPPITAELPQPHADPRVGGHHRGIRRNTTGAVEVRLEDVSAVRSRERLDVRSGRAAQSLGQRGGSAMNSPFTARLAVTRAATIAAAILVRERDELVKRVDD